MTQEEKELLLKDLCGRLSYGVKGIRNYTDEVVTLHFIIPNCKCPNDKTSFIELEFTNLDCCPINTFKPYLRPLSSMTEEEDEWLNDRINFSRDDEVDKIRQKWGIVMQEIYTNSSKYVFSNFTEILDWLNAHHFDYRGLIEKGLALQAPEDMYKN